MKNVEAKFNPDELFFSFTDKTGLILGGNSVFTQISEYTEEELFRKPHNMIRHPSMPKTIFRLFWKTIKNDQPIVAYVKNKTKSDGFYWVLALAFPVPEGYLSIRLKPCSPFLKNVEALYSELKHREETHKDVDENLEWFLKKLKDLGFGTYEAFMQHVLPLELGAREQALKEINSANAKRNDADSSSYQKTNTYLQGLLTTIHEMISRGESLQDAFREINFLTKNMMIATAHLGQDARTVATIAENLQNLTQEIAKGSALFTTHFQTFQATANKIILHIAMMHFQIEMINYDSGKEHNTSFIVGVKNSTENLIKLICESIHSIHDNLTNIERINRDLSDTVDDFVKITLGMNVICIAGKIEISHLPGGSDSIDLSEQLQEMKLKNEWIKATLKELKTLLSKENEDHQLINNYLDEVMCQHCKEPSINQHSNQNCC